MGRRRLEREEAAQEDLYLEARPEPRGSASVSLPGRREGSPTTHTGACRVCEACPGRGGAPLGAEGRAGLLTQAWGWQSSDPARFNSQDCCLLRWGRSDRAGSVPLPRGSSEAAQSRGDVQQPAGTGAGCLLPAPLFLGRLGRRSVGFPSLCSSSAQKGWFVPPGGVQSPLIFGPQRAAGAPLLPCGEPREPGWVLRGRISFTAAPRPLR